MEPSWASWHSSRKGDPPNWDQWLQDPSSPNTWYGACQLPSTQTQYPPQKCSWLHHQHATSPDFISCHQLRSQKKHLTSRVRHKHLLRQRALRHWQCLPCLPSSEGPTSEQPEKSIKVANSYNFHPPVLFYARFKRCYEFWFWCTAYEI